MHESLQHASEPESGASGCWRSRLLNRFFPHYSGEFDELIGRKHKSLLFDRHRAEFILSRVRLMAFLFAILTPLWIPLDIFAFPQDIWLRLALSRVLVSLSFSMLAICCQRSATIRNAYMALGALFIIPSIFFLYSNSLLVNLRLNGIGTTLASGYVFLAFLLVAGLSIFPLTMVELASLALPMLGVAAIPIVENSLYMLPLFNGLAELWLLILVAVVGCLASLSQLQLMRRLTSKAIVDPLTGALNRESGIELISMQFALAQRNNYPLSLAFVDLDNFKKINDEKGHDAGDRVLVKVAQWWRSSLRKSDVLLRWGGDEFLLLFPYTNNDQARLLIYDSIHKFRESDEEIPTLSVGIAELFEDKADQWRSLVRLADKRMYMGKTSGKSKIVVSDTHSTSI